MIFGLTWEKLILIGVIAAVIIGPDRLPAVAAKFAQFLNRAGEMVRDARGRLKEEVGPELDDVDWRKLDPRQYDPRRIIRDALRDDPSPAQPAQFKGAAPSAAAVANDPLTPQRSAPFVYDGSVPLPYDDEAT